MRVDHSFGGEGEIRHKARGSGGGSAPPTSSSKAQYFRFFPEGEVKNWTWNWNEVVVKRWTEKPWAAREIGRRKGRSQLHWQVE